LRFNKKIKASSHLLFLIKIIKDSLKALIFFERRENIFTISNIKPLDFIYIVHL